MKKSLAKLAAVTVLALVGAGTNSLAANSEARADQPANWTINEAVDVNAINSQGEDGIVNPNLTATS